MNTIARFWALLTHHEQSVLAPISAIQAELVDEERSNVIAEGEFLRLRLFAAEEACVPLEIDVGRHESLNRLNVSLGRGGAYCVYESFEDPEDATSTTQDLRDLLLSTIRCREYRSTKRGVLKEICEADRLTIAPGRPMQFEADIAPWPDCGGRWQTKSYRPWLREGEEVSP